jgi:hypothetical protein
VIFSQRNNPTEEKQKENYPPPKAKLFVPLPMPMAQG